MSKKDGAVDKKVKKEAKKIEAELKQADQEIARAGREQQRQERRLKRQARRELAMKEARKRLGVEDGDAAADESGVSEPFGSPADRKEAMNEIRSALHQVRRADSDETRQDAIDDVETLLDKHGEILKAKHIEKIEMRLDKLSAGDIDEDGESDDDEKDDDDDKKEEEDRPGFRPRSKGKGRGRGMKKAKGGRKKPGSSRGRGSSEKNPTISKGRSRGRG